MDPEAALAFAEEIAVSLMAGAEDVPMVAAAAAAGVLAAAYEVYINALTQTLQELVANWVGASVLALNTAIGKQIEVLRSQQAMIVDAGVRASDQAAAWLEAELTLAHEPEIEEVRASLEEARATMWIDPIPFIVLTAVCEEIFLQNETVLDVYTAATLLNTAQWESAIDALQPPGGDATEPSGVLAGAAEIPASAEEILANAAQIPVVGPQIAPPSAKELPHNVPSPVQGLQRDVPSPVQGLQRDVPSPVQGLQRDVPSPVQGLQRNVPMPMSPFGFPDGVPASGARQGLPRVAPPGLPGEPPITARNLPGEPPITAKNLPGEAPIPGKNAASPEKLSKLNKLGLPDSPDIPDLPTNSPTSRRPINPAAFKTPLDDRSTGTPEPRIGAERMSNPGGGADLKPEVIRYPDGWQVTPYAHQGVPAVAVGVISLPSSGMPATAPPMMPPPPLRGGGGEGVGQSPSPASRNNRRTGRRDK